MSNSHEFLKCPNCENIVKHSYKFCNECGTSLTTLIAKGLNQGTDKRNHINLKEVKTEIQKIFSVFKNIEKDLTDNSQDISEILSLSKQQNKDINIITKSVEKLSQRPFQMNNSNLIDFINKIEDIIEEKELDRIYEDKGTIEVFKNHIKKRIVNTDDSTKCLFYLKKQSIYFINDLRMQINLNPAVIENEFQKITYSNENISESFKKQVINLIQDKNGNEFNIFENFFKFFTESTKKIKDAYENLVKKEYDDVDLFKSFINISNESMYILKLLLPIVILNSFYNQYENNISDSINHIIKRIIENKEILKKYNEIQGHLKSIQRTDSGVSISKIKKNIIKGRNEFVNLLNNLFYNEKTKNYFDEKDKLIWDLIKDTLKEFIKNENNWVINRDINDFFATESKKSINIYLKNAFFYGTKSILEYNNLKILNKDENFAKIIDNFQFVFNYIKNFDDSGLESLISSIKDKFDINRKINPNQIKQNFYDDSNNAVTFSFRLDLINYLLYYEELRNTYLKNIKKYKIDRIKDDYYKFSKLDLIKLREKFASKSNNDIENFEDLLNDFRIDIIELENLSEKPLFFTPFQKEFVDKINDINKLQSKLNIIYHRLLGISDDYNTKIIEILQKLELSLPKEDLTETLAKLKDYLIQIFNNTKLLNKYSQTINEGIRRIINLEHVKTGIPLIFYWDIEKKENKIKRADAFFYCLRCGNIEIISILDKNKKSLFENLKRYLKIGLKITLVLLSCFPVFSTINNLSKQFVSFSENKNDYPFYEKLINLGLNLFELNREITEISNQVKDIINFHNKIDIDENFYSFKNFQTIFDYKLRILGILRISEEEKKYNDFIIKKLKGNWYKDVCGFYCHIKCPEDTQNNENIMTLEHFLEIYNNKTSLRNNSS
ncbi:MAG: hypothetical protein ACTSPY_05970 [Candidatus Helarchaeota archaeon]